MLRSTLTNLSNQELKRLRSRSDIWTRLPYYTDLLIKADFQPVCRKSRMKRSVFQKSPSKYSLTRLSNQAYFRRRRTQLQALKASTAVATRMRIQMMKTMILTMKTQRTEAE